MTEVDAKRLIGEKLNLIFPHGKVEVWYYGGYYKYDIEVTTLAGRTLYKRGGIAKDHFDSHHREEIRNMVQDFVRMIISE